MKQLLAMAALLFITCIICTTVQAGPGEDKKPSMDREEMGKRIFALINRERTAHHLNTLTWDDRAAGIARAHSIDMATRNYFSHETPEGATPFQRLKKSGISYSRAAENIFMQPLVKSILVSGGKKSYIYYTSDEVADSICRGWMESPGHRQNILAPGLARSGIGIGEGADDGVPYYYVTQVFYTP